MHRPSHLPITIDDIRVAIQTASKGRKWRKEVRRELADVDGLCNIINLHLKNGTWREDISYRQLTKTNLNGKVRHINAPAFRTLIYEHIVKNKLEPIYTKRAPLVSLNCKNGCGITPSAKNRKSNYVLPRVKHLFYDMRELEWCVCADQRQCYAHVKPSVFRKELKKLIGDKWLIDFATDICFANGQLPVGTPTSPLAHHIIMLGFHRWLCENTEWRVCYADNCLVACRTKSEANSLKWRIRQYWWYELKLRAKKGDTRIFRIDDAKGFDFCGFRLYRNQNKSVMSHNKGYCLLRKSTIKRARKCNNDKSWASYFGLLKHTNSFNEIRNIEKRMKLSALTDKIRIDRKMDAPNYPMSDLVKHEVVFDIFDYTLLKNEKNGQYNWIKCLIGVPELDKDGNKNGKIRAYEFHGQADGIVRYIAEAERQFGKENILPIEDAMIVNQCGYIFYDSTNQIKYIQR